VSLRPSTRQPYKNMTLLGTLPGSRIKNTLNHDRRESRYAKFYGPVSLSALKTICMDEFYVVVPTETNYYTTVRSWDQKPEYSYGGDSSFFFAKVFFRKFYGPLFIQCIASSEEICDVIDWSKSPGFPHTYFGYRTKAELVQALAMTMFLERTKMIPFWNVSGKIEFKKLTDIQLEKIRLFQVPCFELLYSQLKFGKRISSRLMGYMWSYYGFNPYCGGFNLLANRLLKKPYRGCYDVSGWDKFLSLLRVIYGIQLELSDIPEDEMEEFLWMVENTCGFKLKLVNGDVILKDYGNASGSGNTTRDNIFGHIIIFASGLYDAYVTKNGRNPSFQLVSDQIVCLYGDDNVYALDEEFSLMCDQEFLSSHLAKYGLKLKFFSGGVNCDLHRLTFLGASFKLINEIYYPMYDCTRLATTMVYEQCKLSLAQHVGKAFTLMVMSYPTVAFEVFYKAYDILINSDIVVKNTTDPGIKAYAMVGLPEKVSIKAFYDGSESSFDESLVFDFFTSDVLDIVRGSQTNRPGLNSFY
jgi:hypothetical protein